MDNKDQLINRVVDQIRKDMAREDYTALHELLKYLPDYVMDGLSRVMDMDAYLSEEV